MEIQFQQQQQKAKVPSQPKSSKMKAIRNKKFIGVRQRPSGRWVAEIKDTTQKIRMWLGTFESAEEAACAYDEAACLLRGSNTRTNFVTHVSTNSALASRIRGLLNTKNKTTTGVAHAAAKSKKIDTSSSTSTSITTSISCTPQGEVCDPQSLDMDDDSVQGSSSNELLLELDDVYKPDLSSCCLEGGEAWGFDRFSLAGQQMWDLPKSDQDMENSELVEFERMKVERQISASLYAINGLHEYMETVYDPTESFWDLPPLTPLLS